MALKKLKKVLLVFGTRPEAIKMAPLVKEFEKQPNEFEVRVCVTAQHRMMLDQVLDIFNINVNYNLNIMKPNQDLFDITKNGLLRIRSVLQAYQPDICFVQGDTTTTFSTALACFYQKIPVGHVEAGLRTNNIYSPWPEELNRKMIGNIAQYHFAPTDNSQNNLINEGVNESNIIVTGNTVLDALFSVLMKIKEEKKLSGMIRQKIMKMGYSINKNKKIVLVTGHRRESFGNQLINICLALKDIALKYQNIDIIYPVHLNPNVQKPVYRILSDIKNIFLFKPLDYLTFVYLMNKSFILLTDSGGIQEEAPSLGKPVLVTRESTERQEAVHAGTVKLVGTDKDDIIKEICLLIESRDIYNKMSRAHNPYGDGQACKRIVNYIKERLG